MSLLELRRIQLNKDMRTLQNPLVVMLIASGGRGKSLAISTFAPNKTNKKRKNIPLLRERIEYSMRSIVSVLAEGSSRRVSFLQQACSSFLIQNAFTPSIFPIRAELSWYL